MAMAAQSPASTSSPQDASGGNGFSENMVIHVPQPMREDYVQNAVKFLEHPKVKGSPVYYRRSFLEKKGLTKEEIDESFRRVPDPQPNSTDAAAVGSQQVINPNQHTGVQSYAAVQSPQPQAVTGSVNAGQIVPQTQLQPQFSWFNTLLGVGVFVGFGASAAVVVKKLFLPRLKAWTCRVVAEGDDGAQDGLRTKLYQEIIESMKASTSAISAITKTNQELVASKDEDNKILIKLAEAIDSQAEVFKSLSESLNLSRENQSSQYNRFEEHVQPSPWNGPSNNSWRGSQQTNVYSTQPNVDFDSGRYSSTPLPAEPTSGSFSRSYTEQRVQRPGYGFQPQMSNDRWSPGARGNYYGSLYQYHHGGGGGGVEPATVPVAVAEESPFQRRWVPPQPPGVIMPEAAAAIRQPRSLPRQQPQPSNSDEQQMAGASGGEVPATVANANAGSNVTEEEPEASSR